MHVYGTSFVPWCSPLTGERSHFCNKSLRSPLKACVHPSHTLEHVPLHMPLELCIHAGGQKKKKKRHPPVFSCSICYRGCLFFFSPSQRRLTNVISHVTERHRKHWMVVQQVAGKENKYITQEGWSRKLADGCWAKSTTTARYFHIFVSCWEWLTCWSVWDTEGAH